MEGIFANCIICLSDFISVHSWHRQHWTTFMNSSKSLCIQCHNLFKNKIIFTLVQWLLKGLKDTVAFRKLYICLHQIISQWHYFRSCDRCSIKRWRSLLSLYEQEDNKWYFIYIHWVYRNITSTLILTSSRVAISSSSVFWAFSMWLQYWP